MNLPSFDAGEFEKALEAKAGKSSREAFESFKERVLADGGIAEISTYVPPFALRGDIWIGASLANYILKILKIGPQGLTLTGPFSKLMDQYKVSSEAIISLACLFFAAWSLYIVKILSHETKNVNIILASR